MVPLNGFTEGDLRQRETPACHTDVFTAVLPAVAAGVHTYSGVHTYIGGRGEGSIMLLDYIEGERGRETCARETCINRQTREGDLRQSSYVK